MTEDLNNNSPTHFDDKPVVKPEKIISMGHTEWVRSVALSIDSRLALSGSDDKTVRVWDLDSGASRVLEGHTERVWGVALSADARVALSGSADKTVRVWDLDTGASCVLEGHTAMVLGVALS